MNRLKNENSPYLLQHADNPVDWFPWGDEALKKAARDDKPVFLSIGYAACHWCHVMEHESFEDMSTAEIMNKGFINIKVDREERPDIDNIYMNAVVAMTGQGGWPLSVFLTPDGEPFYGGTYFPPTRRYNMPSFQEVLLSVERIWKEDRQQITESAEKISDHLRKIMAARSEGAELDEDTLRKASLSLAQSYDWQRGGWGQAPKFPQPMAIEYLLRQASQGDKFALEIATHALDAMAKGGMYDVVGGGFARYSTDDVWLVPHFEKMLYDNAQLSQVYLYAYLITGDRKYRKVCEDTLEFVLREMRDSEGGFFSSLDADSEGVEGKFYIWSPEEIVQALDNESDIQLVNEAYGIQGSGNFEGKYVLQRKLNDEKLAGKFNIGVEKIEQRLDSIHKQLLSAREQRIRPGTDDKVITSWNGSMMISFAEAGRYLKREDYTQIARQNAEFILENMFEDGILLRSWRQGKSAHSGYLEDYAYLILGLIALYQSDPDTRWFSSALELLNEMRSHFRDPDGGYYDTRDDHENLLLRPRDLQDNAVPSGNALAVNTLLTMSAYTGNVDLHDEAEVMLGMMQTNIQRYPLGFAKWLTALDLYFHPIREVAIIGNPALPETIELKNVLWVQYQPYLVAAFDNYPPSPGSPPLLENRNLKDDRPTAYVCQNFVCQQPVNTPEELNAQLNIQVG